MLLVLKTVARRIVLLAVLFLVWTPVASAWSWPLQGPVLRPFSYDETQPYAAGQHRGLDIGAGAAGEMVEAPAAGTITFAGSVPTSGQSVTIGTADGYSVTLTHLGSIVVAKGESVAERDPIGTVGPSGVPELAGPYVHLGIRVTADPNGYVDPLGVLPAVATSGATDSGSTASQPSSSVATSTPPASKPTPAVAASPPPPVATSRGSTVAPRSGDATVHESGGVQPPRVDAHALQAVESAPAQTAHRIRRSRPSSSSHRPVVEAAARMEPARLGAGHTPQPSIEAAEVGRPLRPVSSTSLALALNGAAALVALGAALAAGRRRRVGTSPIATAQVFRLAEPVGGRRRAA